MIPHSKDFYLCVIEVINYIAQGNRDVSFEKGDELSGNYWPAITDLFKEYQIASVYEGGDIYITRPHRLNPILEDCRNIVREMEKAEDDRNVDRKYKIKGILYGRLSLIISALAFLLSLWVTFRQFGILQI